jgi:hypothetical protein
MATFNLADYETVEERLRKFYSLYEDGRIETILVNREGNIWVVKAMVFLTAGDQANALVKATGYAFEIDGQGMANKTSALENAETSAIGRALANMGLSGNKRASREEMSKVQRASTPVKAAAVAKQDDATWLEKLATVTSLDEARALYKDAQKTASKDVLTAITLKADTLK